MCDKAILESDGTLKSVPDYYKNQQMCNKAAGNYPFALKFVVKCYKTQKKKICDKAIDTYPSKTEYISVRFKTREMCDKAVHKCPFLFDSVPNQYTHKMCDRIVS